MTNAAIAEMSAGGSPRKSEQLRKMLSATACLNVFASSTIPAKLSGRRDVVSLKVAALAPHREEGGVAREPSDVLRAFERPGITAVLLTYAAFDFA